MTFGLCAFRSILLNIQFLYTLQCTHTVYCTSFQAMYGIDSGVGGGRGRRGGVIRQLGVVCVCMCSRTDETISLHQPNMLPIQPLK